MKGFYSSSARDESIIAFSVEPPPFSTRPNVSGFIHRIWRTDEITAVVVDGEQRSFTCVHIIGQMSDEGSVHNTRIFVEGSPITVDEMLHALPRVPDHGVDFTAIQPAAKCLLKRPQSAGDVEGMHALKFTRLAV